MAHKTSARRVLAIAAGCLLLLTAGHSQASYGASGGSQTVPASKTRRVTFVQMSAPHLFDAGVDRHAEGVEEEALDNRSAFHWVNEFIGQISVLGFQPHLADARTRPPVPAPPIPFFNCPILSPRGA